MMLRDRTNTEINKITKSYTLTSEITTITPSSIMTTLYTLISYCNLLPTTRLYTNPFFQFTFTNFSYYCIVSNKAFHREPSQRDSNARKNIHDSSSVGSRCICITTCPSMPIIPCNFMSTRSSKSTKQLGGRACPMRAKRNGPTLSSAVGSIILGL